MGCPCGGKYDWDEKRKLLVCANCGKASPFQPMPDYAQVITERNHLYQSLSEIRDLLQSEATTAHKNAEIQLVVDEALKRYQQAQNQQ